MANKQFRMEKRLRTSVGADISQYALKNQYVLFLYEKITQEFFFGWQFWFFVGFLDQIRLQKTVFRTNNKKRKNLIQYLNILQLTKTFFDNMCILSYKKLRKGWKSIFHECDIKIIKHFADKSFSVFKNAKNSIFEHTKTFFGKMFNYFMSHLWKMLFQPFLDLKKR